MPVLLIVYLVLLLAGFPSVGKSSLLTILTGTESEAAAYEFTTLTCIPGVIHYNDAKIQLLDLPGIIEGAAQGKGRGRQVSLLAGSRCGMRCTITGRGRQVRLPLQLMICRGMIVSILPALYQVDGCRCCKAVAVQIR
jgi:hypothetical protein